MLVECRRFSSLVFDSGTLRKRKKDWHVRFPLFLCLSSQYYHFLPQVVLNYDNIILLCFCSISHKYREITLENNYFSKIKRSIGHSSFNRQRYYGYIPLWILFAVYSFLILNLVMFFFLKRVLILQTKFDIT